MDYFQPPPQARQQQQQQQQPPPTQNSGGGAQYQQQQQQQYNGLAAQQGNSQSNSHMYYQQQMSSQGAAPPYYQQAPNAPIEHGSQQVPQMHSGYQGGNGAGMPPPPPQQQQQLPGNMQAMQQHPGSLQAKSHAGMMQQPPPPQPQQQQQQMQPQSQQRRMAPLMSAQGQSQGGPPQYHQQGPMGGGQGPHANMMHHHAVHHRDNREHQMGGGAAAGGSGGPPPPQGSQGGSGPSQQQQQAPQMTPQQQQQQRTVMMDLPVRLLIENKHVGAIIGQGGSQIKELTRESKAKIYMDTNRKDGQSGYHEKVVSVFGSAEGCTKAVHGILDVIQRAEASKDSKNSNNVELKLRAFNPLVGRLIGRQGATIKKIMNETGTSVQVSNSENQTRVEAPTPPYTMYDVLKVGERTIFIRGPNVDVVSAAEHMISTKLRACHEQDAQTRAQHMGFPQNNAMIPPEVLRQRAACAAGLFPMVIGNNLKSIRMWVPDNMVGPLIGAKGKNIKSIIRETGASVKIESPDEKTKRSSEHEETGAAAEDGEDGKAGQEEVSGEKETTTTTAVPAEGEDEGDGAPEKTDDDTQNASVEATSAEKRHEDERMVTISGNDFEIFKGQGMIFSKIAEQLQQKLEEVKLRTEISVPSKIVGRIIGRGGQNVRELQRITNASVKIPEVDKTAGGAAAAAADTEPLYKESTGDEELTVVRIVGNVEATHNVNFRLAHLVDDYLRNGDAINSATSPNDHHHHHHQQQQQHHHQYQRQMVSPRQPPAHHQQQQQQH